jgi:IclR family pca regulon transcriptional regulator
VAESAGITRAAARRFLHTLVELEYATFDGKHAFLSVTPLLAHTRHTVTSKAELSSILSTVREQGFCIVSEELEEGLRSIAVPVVDREGKVVAAMSVGAQSRRVTMETMRRVFLPELRAAAEEVRRHPLLA